MRIEGKTEEKRSFHRRKGCRFCADSDVIVDYKDEHLLKPYVTERFKMLPSRISGNCARHQRAVSLAVKRARHVAVLPYTSTQIWHK